MLLLRDSLKNAFLASPALRSKISYATLSHRVGLHHPKMGIARARKRTDLCSLCRCWDACVHKECEHVFTSTKDTLSAMVPGYFKDFKTSCLEKQWDFQKPPLDDPMFFTDLNQYIATTDDVRGHLKSDLSETQRGEVSITEAVALTDVEHLLAQVKLFSTHWRLRDYMFESLHKDLADKTPGITYIWSDWQENGNLPRGPEEIAEQWRASARLQYGCHSSYVWGAHCPPNGIQFTVLTRVQDKSGYFTGMVMQELLDFLQSRGILGQKPETGEWASPTDTLHFWSDGAPSYRSCTFMSFPNCSWPQRYRTHCKQSYGLESHLKGIVDRFFGHLDQRLARAEKLEAIKTIADVKRIWEASPGQTEEVFIDFLPEIPRDEWIASHRPLKRQSLPAPIRSSHHWTFKIVDRRRGNLMARDAVTISGVETKSHCLPHMASDVLHTGFVQLLRLDEKEEVEAEEEGEHEVPEEAVETDEKGDEPFGDHTAEHLGWKTSYRKSDPDDVVKHRDKHLRRLQKKHDSFLPVLSRLPAARRMMAFKPSPAAALAAKSRQQSWQNSLRAERAAARLN